MAAKEPFRPDIKLTAGTSESGNAILLEALGDKIILSKLLENLGVPQMPVQGPRFSACPDKSLMS